MSYFKEKFLSKSGFTLAEILLALTVSGIIAALTIPALVTRINDASNLAKFKQTSSDLSAATTKLNMDSSMNTTNGTTLIDSYAKVMNFIKTEPNYPNKWLCYKNNTTYCYEDNSLTANYLTNGVMLEYNAFGAPDCWNFQGDITGLCGQFNIDVNGKNAPNMEGKDVFFIYLVNQGGKYRLVPLGSSGDVASCVAGATQWEQSEGCTTAALLDKLP